LLSVIGFPAFSVSDLSLVNRTRSQIESKLKGKYGCKRFLRDGHQCIVEDTSRLHYEQNELVIFDKIECEWPLFFTYLILDGIFFQDVDRKVHYQELLENCIVHENYPLIPELFYVPAESIGAEKAAPNSQIRKPNENLPLVWAQSLYILGRLLDEDLLHVGEIDPLGRRLSSRAIKSNHIVQISFIAESETLQEKLLQYGIPSQTVEQLQPVNVLHPNALKEAYGFLGKNKKLELTGRPLRPLGVLGTSKIYRILGELYVFLPAFMSSEEFYLTNDNDYLIGIIVSEISFLKNNWDELGRPTMVIMVNEQMLIGESGRTLGVPLCHRASYTQQNLLKFFMSLRKGVCGNVSVRVGRLSDFVPTSCIESLDFLKTNSAEWKKITDHCNEHSSSGRLRLSEEKLKIRDSLKLRRGSMRSPNSAVIPSPLPDFASITILSPSPGPESLIGVNVSPMSSPLSGEETPGCYFTVGDNRKAKEAVEFLRKTGDLYEQADSLHYLASCYPLEHETDLGTLRDLLDEVYRKAVALRKWSVVRLSAGLLRKTVNSLTSNLADLLVRQKRITIGYNDVVAAGTADEVTITTPLSPDAISTLIIRHCIDPRESVMVQEIITYLGALIRGEPDLFQGILRVRVHSLLAAMRDEIVGAKGCTEYEAMDLLYSATPYHISCLILSIFSNQENYQPLDTSLERRPPKKSNVLLEGNSKVPGLCSRNPEKSLTSKVHLQVQSAGFLDGNFARFFINGDEVPLGGRGFNVVVIDQSTGILLESGSFDTHLEKGESANLAEFLSSVDEGMLVVLIAKDDVTENLTEEVIREIESLGSTLIRKCKYRDSFCLIASRDLKENALEELCPAQKGPTKLISYEFEVESLKGSMGAFMRKRKNNGSLQRVPKEFYAKIWHVLDRCQGLCVLTKTVPRNPTVADKTPGEYNFAMQIEDLLDGFKDPAERQISVELLMLIYDLLLAQRERLSIMEVPLGDIIRDAVERFWGKRSVPYVSQSDLKDDGAVDTTFRGRVVLDDVPEHRKKSRTSRNSSPEARFERYEQVARKLFYNLPVEGPGGTLEFLEESLVAIFPMLNRNK
jgi:hypothetical protein